VTAVTDTPLIPANPTQVHQAAMDTLARVTEEHQEAAAASDAARTALAELEAAADRGEQVDTEEYTRRKAALSIASRRTAALTRVIQTAKEKLYQAQEDVHNAYVRELKAAVPSADKAYLKALRASQEYATALIAQDDAIRALYQAAKDAPSLPHPAPEGATGWPTSSTFHPGTGETVLGRRIGYLLVDGEKVERPQVGAALARLAEEIDKQGR
jgi:hypothetical protein